MEEKTEKYRKTCASPFFSSRLQFNFEQLRDSNLSSSWAIFYKFTGGRKASSICSIEK